MRKNLMAARGKPARSFRTQPIPGNTVTGGTTSRLRRNQALMRAEEVVGESEE